VRDFGSRLFSLSCSLFSKIQRLFDRFAVSFDAKIYVLERRFALNLTPLSVLVGSIMFFVENQSGESCHTK
jgi:hypothetical protein